MRSILYAVPDDHLFRLFVLADWVAAIKSVEIQEYSVGIVLFPIYPAKIRLALVSRWRCCVVSPTCSMAGNSVVAHDGSDTRR